MLDSVLSYRGNLFVRFAFKLHIENTLLFAFCWGVKLYKVWENAVVC